jgi:hypothetical protein
MVRILTSGELRQRFNSLKHAFPTKVLGHSPIAFWLIRDRSWAETSEELEEMALAVLTEMPFGRFSLSGPRQNLSVLPVRFEAVLCCHHRDGDYSWTSKPLREDRTT